MNTTIIILETSILKTSFSNYTKGMIEEHPQGHSEIRHTADIAVKVWSPTMDGLFQEAFLAVRDYLHYQPVSPETAHIIPIHVEAVDGLDCLIQFLNEVLYHYECGSAARDLEIRQCSPAGIVASLTCVDCLERWSSIKAVTFHGGEITGNHPGYVVTLVFDS